MSETTPEATATATEPDATSAPPTSTPDTPPAQPDTETDVEHWKRMAREQERRAKANADAAKRLTEIEESQKSEQQKAIDRAAAIERERDEARADGLRYKAAAKHGIGEDYFDLLGSGDEETINDRAQRVGQLVSIKAENEQLKAELEALRAGKPAPVGGRPVEALKPGATPENFQSQEDADYVALFGSAG